MEVTNQCKEHEKLIIKLFFLALLWFGNINKFYFEFEKRKAYVWANHPPPQHQCAWIGYTIPVITIEKRIYPLKLHLSAIAPDTIVAHVAANVLWSKKNQKFYFLLLFIQPEKIKKQSLQMAAQWVQSEYNL